MFRASELVCKVFPEPRNRYKWTTAHGTRFAYDRGQGAATPDATRVANAPRITMNAVLFFSCPDVDAAYQHLRSPGVNSGAPTIASCAMKQRVVKDPDSYNVCLQWPG